MPTSQHRSSWVLPWMAAAAGYGVAELIAFASAGQSASATVLVAGVVAGVVAAALEWCGVAVVQSGAVLASPGGFAYEIDVRCLGLAPILALAGLLFGEGGLDRRRALGALACGTTLLVLLNFARLTSLFWLGVERPHLVPGAHDVLWPLVFTMLLIAAWHRARGPAPSPVVSTWASVSS